MTDRTAASYAAELVASLDALAATRAGAKEVRVDPEPNVAVVPDDELAALYDWIHEFRHPLSIRELCERAAHEIDEDLRAWTVEELREAFGR